MNPWGPLDAAVDNASFHKPTVIMNCGTGGFADCIKLQHVPLPPACAVPLKSIYFEHASIVLQHNSSLESETFRSCSPVLLWFCHATRC